MKLPIEDFLIDNFDTGKTETYNKNKWNKYGYYWEDVNGEQAIVPKDKMEEFLNEVLDFAELDADTVGYYEQLNEILREEIGHIDNDYIGFEMDWASNYWEINMQVLYSAIDEGEWNYE